MGTHISGHRWQLPVALGAVGVLLCAATACSGATSSSGSSRQFTYWSMWKEGEPQQKVLALAVTDFEKQTGIKVKVQWQGRNNLQKLVPALNTNNVPDLVDGPYVKLVPALVATQQSLGLTSAFDTEVDGSTAGKLIPAKYLKTIDIDDAAGRPWMVPYSITSDAVWYDAAAHPELRREPPRTWDEFIALLDRIKKDGRTPLAADGDVTGYNAAFLSTLIVRNLGPGGLKKVASDRTGKAWLDPAVLDAAKKVEQLVRGGYLIDGYKASKWPAEQQKWANGKAELMFNGSWLPTESATYAAKGFAYAAFPFPVTAAGHSSMRADFVGFAVPKKADDAKDAQRFAAFLLGKKYQDAMGRQAKVIPVRADAATSPEMADVKKALDQADSFHQQNDGVAFPGYNEKLFWAKDDELFFGKISAEEFVHQMQGAQATYWKDQPQ
ncbi:MULTISPECIES: extracellular solute-binding protein [unclassified Streptomyces]|uniref:ABC transporter substrate-binding protein n=1 Tax=unclassified Streptomyces TaxID=2593676 RepID=UPI0033BD2327